MPPHAHVIDAHCTMRLLDYDTFTIGCAECGPQWVVTINWYDNTFAVSWVNQPINVYYDSFSREFTIQQGDGGGITVPVPDREQ